jgi:hypothetical protein
MKLFMKLIHQMNFTAINQMLTIFIIISIGPACIAYLAYKKVL